MFLSNPSKYRAFHSTYITSLIQEWKDFSIWNEIISASQPSERMLNLLFSYPRIFLEENKYLLRKSQ